MSSPPRGRSSWRARGGRLSRSRTVLGVPSPVILIAVVLSVLLGILLAFALQTSTTSSTGMGSTSVEGSSGPGRNASGLSVITESTLGPEVQPERTGKPGFAPDHGGGGMGTGTDTRLAADPRTDGSRDAAGERRHGLDHRGASHLRYGRREGGRSSRLPSVVRTCHDRRRLSSRPPLRPALATRPCARRLRQHRHRPSRPVPRSSLTSFTPLTPTRGR